MLSNRGIASMDLPAIVTKGPIAVFFNSRSISFPARVAGSCLALPPDWPPRSTKSLSAIAASTVPICCKASIPCFRSSAGRLDLLMSSFDRFQPDFLGFFRISSFNFEPCRQNFDAHFDRRLFILQSVLRKLPPQEQFAILSISASFRKLSISLRRFARFVLLLNRCHQLVRAIFESYIEN